MNFFPVLTVTILKWPHVESYNMNTLTPTASAAIAIPTTVCILLEIEQPS
jgi:hypothetical protein